MKIVKDKAKKVKILMLAALIICCVGGVYAYWTQVLIAHNDFMTPTFDTSLEEEFISPENWMPGEETNKDVWIRNKGEVPAFVRVAINQKWITDSGEDLPLVFNPGGNKEYAAQIGWGDVVLLASGQTSPIGYGLPVVSSPAQAKGKWLLVSDEPDANGDLLLYYIGLVEAGSDSPQVVDYVTMNPNIEPEILSKKITFDKATGKQMLDEVSNPTYSYEEATYTMLITATTVQGTPSAVRATFNASSDVEEVVEYLAGIGLSEDISAE